jgi:hypothetical protein
MKRKLPKKYYEKVTVRFTYVEIRIGSTLNQCGSASLDLTLLGSARTVLYFFLTPSPHPPAS